MADVRRARLDQISNASSPSVLARDERLDSLAVAFCKRMHGIPRTPLVRLEPTTKAVVVRHSLFRRTSITVPGTPRQHHVADVWIVETVPYKATYTTTDTSMGGSDSTGTEYKILAIDDNAHYRLARSASSTGPFAVGDTDGLCWVGQGGMVGHDLRRPIRDFLGYPPPTEPREYLLRLSGDTPHTWFAEQQRKEESQLREVVDRIERRMAEILLDVER